MDNRLLLEDLEYINSCDWIPWNQLNNKTVLVTGATGLIGKMLVKALVYVSSQKGLDIKVVALVRDINKANTVFADIVSGANGEYDSNSLSFLVGDVTQLDALMDDLMGNKSVDYIIHGANPTASKFFVEHPVETVSTAVDGTKAVLELARRNNCLGVCFLSTMEVYGHPNKGAKVTEDMVGNFDSTNPRNSYPLSKLICENMCVGYAKEYDVPTKIVRLTQTFGLGVDYNDGRVFAEFARCAIEHRDIVLKTKGETERSYLYTADAVTAIVAVLLGGADGEAYTAANDETYCSIYDMAKGVADANDISVHAEEQDVSKLGYANTLYMDLETSKIANLDWNASFNLDKMYSRMIADMKSAL